MQLTKKERIVLVNQYRNLMALTPENKDELAKICEILERGYELHYPSISSDIADDSDVLNKGACDEVWNLLAMFDTIIYSYKTLPDKTGIDETNIGFSGFDGNHENKQASYARFLCIMDNTFPNVAHRIDINSHIPKLPTYRKMLVKWEKVKKKQLTKDDIVYLTS